MKRALLRNASLYTRDLLVSPPIFIKPNPNITTPLLSLPSTSSTIRFFSSDNDSPPQNPNPLPETNLAQTQNKQLSIDVEDVSNKELKTQINKYFKGDEEELPSIFEAIFRRKLVGKHEDTDDELTEELRMKPIDDVSDKDFESDFEGAHETDEEIDNLYNARAIVTKRMEKDDYFHMDEKRWDEMINEAIGHGYLKDTRECEKILDDMQNWEKLLPDEIKRKVEEKFDEIAARVENGELEDKEGYKLFQEFEDKMVAECTTLMEAEEPQLDETAVTDQKKNSDDPPGEGPILRWLTRVVFAPGGDAWHPKNRKVKLAVTVKELGLSKHQFRRMRELVGKRYHSGKDELTITSERFEHREENRKDCLRTLFSLIEEAGKANQLVEVARTSYVKERLRANPNFMERLLAKTMRTSSISA